MAEIDIRHIYLVGGSLARSCRGRAAVLAIGAVGEGDAIQIVCRFVLVLQRCRSASSMSFIASNSSTPSVSILRSGQRPCSPKFVRARTAIVGYDDWIAALEYAVKLWGSGRVYSAMVAGIELEPEHDMDWQQAAALAVQGAEDLCSRGIIPVYSLHWPAGGKERPDYQTRLRNFFETLAVEYRAIRERHDLQVWAGVHVPSLCLHATRVRCRPGLIPAVSWRSVPRTGGRRRC